jgi:DnaJ-class molecular chaperone
VRTVFLFIGIIAMLVVIARLLHIVLDILGRSSYRTNSWQQGHTSQAHTRQGQRQHQEVQPHLKEVIQAYATLEMPPDASLAEVKQAYRDLVKVWHPDRFSHDADLHRKAQEKMKALNDAYEHLRRLGRTE